MTESRGRRGQIISACNSCWKRKVTSKIRLLNAHKPSTDLIQIRCDSGKPKCSWCVHYKTTCIYQRDGNRHCQSRQINSRMGEACKACYLFARHGLVLTSHPVKPARILLLKFHVMQDSPTIVLALMIRCPAWPSLRWSVSLPLQ
jgi:hypothetical protein